MKIAFKPCFRVATNWDLLGWRNRLGGTTGLMGVPGRLLPQRGRVWWPSNKGSMSGSREKGAVEKRKRH